MWRRKRMLAADGAADYIAPMRADAIARLKEHEAEPIS